MPVTLTVRSFHDDASTDQVEIDATPHDLLSALRLNSVAPIVPDHEILAVMVSDDDGSLIFKCLNVPLLEEALLNSAAADINRIEQQLAEVTGAYEALKVTSEDYRLQLEQQAGSGTDQLIELAAHETALEALRSENAELKAAIDTLTAPPPSENMQQVDETPQKAAKSGRGQAKAT